MKSIEELLSRFSQAELLQGVEQVKAIINTPEGAKLRQKIAAMDKKELMQKLNDLDATSRRGNVAGYSNKDIIDKLNQFCDRK